MSEKLINSVLEKFENGDKKTVSECNDYINLGSFDKEMYENEFIMIKNELELEVLNENRFIEFDFIIGDCYLCNEKIEDNFIIHVNEQHGLSIKNTIEDFTCLICGEKMLNRKSFIKHQFNLHGIISLVSLNKLFKIQMNSVAVGYDDQKNSQKQSIFSSLNISDKMRERVNLIKNQNRNKKKMVRIFLLYHENS